MEIPALSNTPVGGYMERVGADESEDKHETSFLRRALPWAGAAAASGLTGYAAYKGLRRYALHGTASLRALQEQAKGLPFVVSQPKDPTRGEQVLGGNTYRKATPQRPPTKQEKKDFLLRNVPYPHGVEGSAPESIDAAMLTYAPSWDRSTTKPKVPINYGRLAEQMSNKGDFDRIMRDVGNGAALPHTRTVQDLMQEAEQRGMSLFKTRSGAAAKSTDMMAPETEYAVDHDVLSKLFGHKDYLIKPTLEACAKADSFLSSGDAGFDPRAQSAFSTPQYHVVQEKMPIKHEYRVHAVDDQPVAYLHRRSPNSNKHLANAWDAVTRLLGAKAGGAAVPVLSPQKREQLDAFMRPALAKLRNSPHWREGQHMHQGFDVAELPDGTFKFIESNPWPATHTENPYVSSAVEHAVTGRHSRRVAGAGALAAGGLAGGLGVARALDDDGDNKQAAEEDDAGGSHAGAAAGLGALGAAGAGLTAYRALRKPKYVENNPEFRAIQERANTGGGYGQAFDVADQGPFAAPEWLRTAYFRPGGPTRMEKFKSWWHGGGAHVPIKVTEEGTAQRLAGPANPSVVHGRGTIGGLSTEPFPGALAVGNPSPETWQGLSDLEAGGKHNYGRRMNEWSPGAIPESFEIDPKKHGRTIQQLQSRLQEEAKQRGWDRMIIKPQGGARSGGRFPSVGVEGESWAEHHKAYRDLLKMPGVAEYLKEFPTQGARQNYLQMYPGAHEGWVVDQMMRDPRSVMAQQYIPNVTRELRAHSIAGHVPLDAIIDRRNPDVHAPLNDPALAAEVKAFTEKHLRNMPPELRGGMFSPDVMVSEHPVTKQRQMHFAELNANFDSHVDRQGFLSGYMNPYHTRSMARAITGRTGVPQAVAKALMAAGATGLGIAGSLWHPFDKRKAEQDGQ